jgi:serine/threonine protein kinase
MHAAGAVHRDVKGANVVVRLSDRWPVLLDFGSCHFQGAQRLTWLVGTDRQQAVIDRYNWLHEELGLAPLKRAKSDESLHIDPCGRNSSGRIDFIGRVRRG